MSKLKIYRCSGVGASSVADSVYESLVNSGWSRNETLRKYLGTSADGGCAEYFLYTFIPEEDLAKYNATIYRKRKQQLKTFEYVRELFVEHGYGTEEDMVAIIRNGIENTFGYPVETVLQGIRTGKNEGVGGPIIWTAAAIASIITAVVSAVVAIVTGIISYCQAVKVAKYTAPTMEEIEESAPAATDFTSGIKKKGLLFSALAGVALLALGSLKKNK